MSKQVEYAEKALSLKKAAATNDTPGAAPNEHDPDYWNGLIDEAAAAAFLGLTIRCLQGWRYRGGELKYVRVSARCIRYRRRDLREWAEARLRTSTSDTDAEAA